MVKTKDRTRSITTRVTPEDYDYIFKFAHEGYISMGQYFYKCIQIQLEKDKKKK